MYRVVLLGMMLLLSGCSMERSSQGEAPMLEVTSYETVDPLIGRGKPLLLELGSTSCGGCRDMARTLYAIKRDYPQSGIYFVDIKSERYVARQYEIRMMPTQVILDASGKEIDRHIGVTGTAELLEKLRRFGVIE